MMDDQELIFFEEATLQGGPVQWKLRKELGNVVDRFIVLHYKKAIKLITLPSISVCFNLVIKGGVRMLAEGDSLIKVPEAAIFGVFRGPNSFIFQRIPFYWLSSSRKELLCLLSKCLFINCMNNSWIYICCIPKGRSTC